MERIVVIGTSCSGKTTFAREFAKILDIEHIELDALYWEPNWKVRDSEQFKSLVESRTNKARWIVDGNYSMVRDILWLRATTIIWLNYAFPIVLYRAIVRSFKRSMTKEVLFSGNQESFRRSFLSKESIILWVINTHSENRRRYSSLLSSASAKLIEFKTTNETKKFLKNLML
ncbi:adenylate kinase [Candidatus Thiomargarita nelsonii]|uniref:Adenylate kinase n=1 Tax=Candidatus Thiomargarita nelsonii TaxID=1003181 RepID=A0A0A6PJ29_9GAMM|nr:adenylate kinase [Candidatus Thiomargarita nelsonii]